MDTDLNNSVEEQDVTILNSEYIDNSMSLSNQQTRKAMHRPSVRSISESPNIIGVYAGPYENDIFTYCLTGLTWIIIIMFFPLSLIFICRVVQEYERVNIKPF